MKKVYIVVVNWNGCKDTLECLESLLALDYSPFTVVICDNGSLDESLHRFRDWFDERDLECLEYSVAEAETGGVPAWDAQFVLIRNGANLGFAGGNNVALRYALARDDFDYAWLLNNDTVVEPDALTHLVRRMEGDPVLGMCGSTVRYYSNRERVQAAGGGCYLSWLGLPWHYGRLTGKWKALDPKRAERFMNYVEGASLFVSRSFLAEVGLMNEDYFLYFEEADWAQRARGHYRIGYAPQSVVYHKVGSSIGTATNPRRKSYTCDFYNIRNRILFTRRYFPKDLPTVYLVLMVELMLRLFLCKWDRVTMIFKLLIHPPGGEVHAAARKAR